MENNGIVSIIINNQTFKDVEYNLLSSNIKDVGGMVDDSTYAFELKPHAKDFDNIDNLLNCIKENKEKIKLIFDNKTSLESYVTNSTGDKKTTSITVITAALL